MFCTDCLYRRAGVGLKEQFRRPEMTEWLSSDSVFVWREGAIRKYWEQRITGGGCLDVRCGGKSETDIESLISGLANWVNDDRLCWDGVVGEGSDCLKDKHRERFVVRCLRVDRCSPGGDHGPGLRREISAGAKTWESQSWALRTAHRGRMGKS